MSTPAGTLSIQLAASEVLDATEAPGATPQQRTLQTGVNGLNRVTLNSTSVPKVDKPIVAFNLTLTSGSPTTIDLTAIQALAMPLGASRVKDLTAAKIKAWAFSTPGTNTAVVNVAPGASNPYNLFGASNDIDVPIASVMAGAFNAVESTLPAVAAGAKTLTFSTTHTGDQIYVELWAGT